MKCEHRCLFIIDWFGYWLYCQIQKQKNKKQKNKSGLTFWIRFYMVLDDMSFALAWLSATDIFFLVFFVLFCFWKWMRKLRIFYFAYSQSHSSRSDHGGQEFWYFLRVECILLKLQNLASLGAEFVPRSLLQRFFLSQGLCWNLYCLLRGTPVFIDWTLTIPANGVNPVLFMEEQEPERTKDTRRIKKKKKKRKNGRNTVHSQPRPNNVYSTD